MRISNKLGQEMIKHQLTPVIVQAVRGEYKTVMAEIIRRGLDVASENAKQVLREPVLQLPFLPPLETSQGVSGLFTRVDVPGFEMINLLCTQEDILELNNIAQVQRIYWDAPVYITDAVFLDEVYNRYIISSNEIFPTLGIDRAHDQGYSGEGVKVAVLDTGVDLAHPSLLRDVKSKTVPPFPPVDGNGHGTFCIGTIKGKHIKTPYGFYI